MFIGGSGENNQKGAMALSSILALSLILLALGLAMSYSGFVNSNIVYNQDKAAIAFYISEAGAKDAMQKITRNKNYISSGYCLVMEGGRADVVVSMAGEQTEIFSTGITGVANCEDDTGSNIKKIKVVLNIDSGNDGNGKISIVSWEEVGS